MADREIHVPFGPDKTGGMGVLPPVEASDGRAAESDPFAEPESGAHVSEAAGERSGRFSQARPAQSPEPDAPDAPDADSGEYHAGGMSDEEATAQGYDEMQMSFMALRDSVGQGRELKAREKELDEFEAQLDADREELADREHILANYAALVEEQDRVIAQSNQQREAQKAELSQVIAKLEETADELERMKDYHVTEMQPLEVELGRVRANADQAKNDERSRKSELSAAESEVRRAGSEGAAAASAQRDQVRRAYEDARLRSEQAKGELAEVERIYNDALQQIEQTEGPLERSIEDLKLREEDLKDSIARLGEEVSTARKRRQYCDAVYQYPDETAKLRASVAKDEGTLNEMIAENDELRDQLAQSKKLAKKAKIALGIVAVIVVVFIIALIVILARG